jgi:formate dehydrogenase
MMILALVRNYIPSDQWVIDGGWNIADCVSRSYDLEGMEVGTVGAGRIGSAVLRRLKPFEVGCTTPIVPASPRRWSESSASPTTRAPRTWCPSATWSRSTRRCTRRRRGSSTTSSSPQCAATHTHQHRARRDLRPRRDRAGARVGPTRRLRRRCLVPPARSEGSPPADHAPPRCDPHTSGTSLSSQARYAAGTREILECWFDDRPIPDEYLIVDGGKLAGTGAHSYSAKG